MKSFVAFVSLPLAVAGAVTVSPILSRLIVTPPESISVQQLTLPPGIRELKETQSTADAGGRVRLEALMPSTMIDRVRPIPAKPVIRPAAERYRLSSVLLAPTQASAVVDGQVLFVGSRLGEYRLHAIKQDSVLLTGPRGTELLSLDGGAQDSLFPVSKVEKGSVSFRMPAKKSVNALAVQQLPPDELERQFRHLLENFSH